MSILDQLEPYFEELNLDLDIEKIDKLYEIFKNDLVNNTIDINGIPLRIKSQLSSYREIPELSKYNHDFVHCITRRSDLSGNRRFEPKRANRVHWIRLILENRADNRIRYFKFKESDGRIRDYFWFEEKEFVVVVEILNAEYILISSHCVDDYEKYRKRYHCYQKHGV